MSYLTVQQEASDRSVRKGTHLADQQDGGSIKLISRKGTHIADQQYGGSIRLISRKGAHNASRILLTYRTVESRCNHICYLYL